MRLARTNIRRLPTAAALVTLLAAFGCSGDGSSPTAPQVVVPTSTPPPSSSVLGTYGTQPCCCGFWTYTLIRGGETSTWTCWGAIEIRTENGGDLTGLTDLARDATACPDQGKCTNLMVASHGRLDSAGALTWTHGAGTYYSDHVAEKNGCTVVSDGGTMTGTLIDGALSMSSTSVLRCNGKTAELTLSARGVKIH